MTRQLAAIVYMNTKKLDAINYTPRYRMIKLFDNSTTAPVADAKIATAIRYVEERGYKPRGYWLNDLPAIAWSPSPSAFQAACPRKPVLHAPCRFARRNGDFTARKVGDAGYILPTRTRAQLWQLRQRYPSWMYIGDILMVPEEILYQHKVTAEKRLKLDRQAAAGHRQGKT